MMFNKDKTKDRNRRFSESMKEALTEYKFKKENNIPIENKLRGANGYKKETTKLPNLPGRIKKRNKYFV